MLIEHYASQDKCFKFFLYKVAERISQSACFLHYTYCLRLLFHCIVLPSFFSP